MFNIIEVTTATYNDTSWQMTFYYIATLAFLIGAFWTYYQVFIKSKKKKQPLKENIIYNNTEDVIEEYCCLVKSLVVVKLISGLTSLT